MTVYDILDLANDLSGVTVTVWDCDCEGVVFDSRNAEDDPDGMDVAYALYFSDKGIGDYEVDSYDLYKDRDGSLCLELNISMGEE